MNLSSELQAALDEARQLVTQRDITGAEAALNRLEASRKAFAEEVLTEYAAEHQTVIGAVVTLLRKGFVLQAMLGIHLPGLHYTRIADLRDPSKIVFDVNDLRRIVQSGGWERALGPGGLDDAEAATLYRKLGPIHQATEELERLTGRRSGPSAPGKEFLPDNYSHRSIVGCATTTI
jgi:hypothetical protein